MMSYCFLTYPQVMSTPGTLIGSLTSSNDVYPDLSIPNRQGTQKHSPTDVGLGPNISNIYQSRANSLFPPLQIMLWHHGQYQPMRAPTKYIQYTSGLSQYLSGYEYLTCQTPRFLSTFPNRRFSPTKFPEPPPRHPEILSTETRAFEPSAITSPVPYEILDPGGPPTQS